MSQNRRTFLKSALAAAGAMGIPTRRVAGAVTPPGEDVGRAPEPLRILILGGTGFTGPYQVRYAVARGHRVSVFNRGRSQADLPGEVEHLTGDRDTGDLDALKGREWDVVIDNPTTLPFWARDAASLLQDAARQYVFTSTISVYASFQPGMDEDAPVAEYRGADPMAETMETLRADVNNLYGPLKAISEQEVARWFPGRTTVIRPGLIVGPGDASDRFTYWPVRIDRGGDILAPDALDDPVQFIDARDLAEWTVRTVEAGTTGVFNALGPRSRLSLGEMLHGIRAAVSGDRELRFVYVPPAFLEAHDVRPWTDMPVWEGPPENGGGSTVSHRRAVEAGLTFRPLAVTAADTLAWFRSLPPERRNLRWGLAAEREAEVLAAWEAEES